MPGAFQLDVFLVVLVNCVVVKLVHVSRRINFISSFSSWSHVASGLCGPLLFHRLHQNCVMSSFKGGVRDFIQFAIGSSYFGEECFFVGKVLFVIFISSVCSYFGF